MRITDSPAAEANRRRIRMEKKWRFHQICVDLIYFYTTGGSRKIKKNSSILCETKFDLLLVFGIELLFVVVIL